MKDDVKKLDLTTKKTDLSLPKNLYTGEPLKDYTYYFTPLPKIRFLHTGNSKFTRIGEDNYKKPTELIPPEYM